MKIRYQVILMMTVIFIGIVIGVVIEVRRQIPALTLARTLDAPLRDNSKVSLIVVGDTGTGNDNQRKVAALMEKVCVAESPNAIVLLGDNFYEHGVATTDDAQWRIKFTDVYNAPCIQKLKVYAILGNHDYEGSPTAQIEYTKISPEGRWNMPSRYYSVRFGALVDLFAVDTNFPDKCFFAGCSLSWTERELKYSKAKWKVVAGHHPLRSGGRYDKPKPIVRWTLPSTLCDGGASVYLTAHDHALQHLKGNTMGGDCVINQFISGGGGGNLYPPKTLEGLTQFAATTHGFLVARFTPERADYLFYGTESDAPLYETSELATAAP